MFNYTMKVSYYLLFLSVFLFFASGCETISSFNSGDVNMQDLARMVKYGGGTPKGKPSRGPRENSFADEMHNADSWLRKNLW